MSLSRWLIGDETEVDQFEWIATSGDPRHARIAGEAIAQELERG